MDSIKKEKIENLFKNKPEIVKEIEKLNGKDSVVEMFANHGIEMSDEDLYDLLKEYDLLPEPQEDQLDDDDLENVSGGIWTIKLAVYAGYYAAKTIQKMYDKVTTDWDYKKKKI